MENNAQSLHRQSIKIEFLFFILGNKNAFFYTINDLPLLLVHFSEKSDPVAMIT